MREVLACFDEAIVVDDGSGLPYATLFDEANALGATVLTHEQNRGKGAALKTAFAFLASPGAPLNALDSADIVVTLDADGQHTPEDAKRLCNAAAKNPGALILGTRTFSQGTPWRSKWGNTLMCLLFKLRTGVRLNDTQTGLRAFSANLLPFMLDIEGERYEYETAVLTQCATNHLPLREVPIQTIYINNNKQSHYHAFADSVRIARELFRFASSSLLSFVVDYVIYSALTLILTSGHLIIANIGARAVSSALNFTLNRRMVFKSKEPLLRALVKYYLLVILILVLNTTVLELLVSGLAWNPYLAKILVEVLFFSLSWTLQRLVVFPKKTREDTASQQKTT